MSLIEKEKIYEKPLKELHLLAIEKIEINKKTTILSDVQSVVSEWDSLLGTTTLSLILSMIIQETAVTKDDAIELKHLKLLDFLLGPLEYYMIALEEMKSTSHRDTVTRCGMVCERITNKLLIELGASDLANNKVKFANKIGRLQNELSKRGITFSQDFCATMTGIYNIRSYKGPHDVPAAEEIEAKHCVGTIPMLYSRYLEILILIGYDISSFDEDLNVFVNNLISFGTILPTVGKGGTTPQIGEIIMDLYRQGFFAMKRTVKEVVNKFDALGYGFPRSSIHNALNRLMGKILNRSGRRGNYTYIQRIPPAIYFGEK